MTGLRESPPREEEGSSSVIGGGNVRPNSPYKVVPFRNEDPSSLIHAFDALPSQSGGVVLGWTTPPRQEPILTISDKGKGHMFEQPESLVPPILILTGSQQELSPMTGILIQGLTQNPYASGASSSQVPVFAPAMGSTTVTKIQAPTPTGGLVRTSSPVPSPI